jgi:hypothetical protein
MAAETDDTGAAGWLDPLPVNWPALNCSSLQNCRSNEKGREFIAAFQFLMPGILGRSALALRWQCHDLDPVMADCLDDLDELVERDRLADE